MKIEYKGKEYQLTTCVKAKEIRLCLEDGATGFLQSAYTQTPCLIFEEIPQKPNAIVDYSSIEYAKECFLTATGPGTLKSDVNFNLLRNAFEVLSEAIKKP